MQTLWLIEVLYAIKMDRINQIMGRLHAKNQVISFQNTDGRTLWLTEWLFRPLRRLYAKKTDIVAYRGNVCNNNG